MRHLLQPVQAVNQGGSHLLQLGQTVTERVGHLLQPVQAVNQGGSHLLQLVQTVSEGGSHSLQPGQADCERRPLSTIAGYGYLRNARYRVLPCR